ncbi:di-trans,poly-cis-decaprenylcistransferase [Candidatus Woesearchaeota archaeon]|nr:MAG: di-trans,poly-cis-decaprenylcistransferase [Candidatus Woesearchaeota archaeon]
MQKEKASAAPRHIGVILDGNRRFAKRLMKRPWEGHRWGAEKVKQFLKWCDELGIEEVTLYAFSMQNFHRPKNEFDYLMDLFQKTCNELLEKEKELSEQGLRIRFVGRLHLLPQRVQEGMSRLMAMTEKNERRRLNIAVAYGGREEVVDAVKRIALEVREGRLSVEDIDENTVSQNLYFASEPDLIIRTGGECRTSNFLIWQANYAEWFFLEKCWPEFEKQDLVACIDDFKSRERRFGR